jgi:hypothetical protein
MSKTVPQKYKKKGNPNGLPFHFFIGSVETQNFASLHHPMVIYCMTVTRLTVTPSSV